MSEEQQDRLVEALTDFVQERKEELGEEAYRAVQDERHRDNDRRLGRLESRMDGIMLLLIGSIVAQLVAPLLTR